MAIGLRTMTSFARPTQVTPVMLPLVRLAENMPTDKSSHKSNRQDAAAVQLQTGREKTCWSSLLVQNARLPVAGPIDGTQV